MTGRIQSDDVTHISGIEISRRAALRGAGAGLLAASLGGLPSRAAPTVQAERSLPLVTGAFVGELPALNAFIAVVASVPEPDATQREVRAYLCDGAGVNVWFTGNVDGHVAVLTTDDQYQVEALLTPEAAFGVVATAANAPVPFTAPAATGIAGLYDVTLGADGVLSGAVVEGDARLVGAVVEHLDDGHRLAAGSVRQPGHQRWAWAAYTTGDAAGELRFVVMPTGQTKGAGKKDTGDGWVYDNLQT